MYIIKLEIISKVKEKKLYPYLFLIRTRHLIIRRKDVGVTNQEPARIRIFQLPNMASLFP